MKNYFNFLAKISSLVIMRWFLAFVVLWFGVNEIMRPGQWTYYVPHFLNQGGLGLTLVIIHGALLSAAGLALVFNLRVKIASAFLALMLLQIIINFIPGSGVSSIVVRDIGLLGLSLAILFYPRQA